MNKEQLIELLRKILQPDLERSEDEYDALVEQFVESIPHPGGCDLLFYPAQWGLSDGMTAEEIATAALNWKPRVIAMQIVEVGRHPCQDDLFRCGVEVIGQCRTQIVSPVRYEAGDVVAVALSGVTLPDGEEIVHEFVKRVYSVGKTLGLTKESPGREIRL